MGMPFQWVVVNSADVRPRFMKRPATAKTPRPVRFAMKLIPMALEAGFFC
jgi:hypothetical protein